MNTLRGIVTVASLLAFGLDSVALAQGGPGGGGRASGRNYDTKTVETITGEVVAINIVSPGRGGGPGGGVHMMVRTDKEEIAVHLGPKWYLDEQTLKPAIKDRVEIRGSRVTQEGKPVIIAAEVKKGDQVLKLRDEGGRPLWGGKGRRQGPPPGRGSNQPAAQ
jgi:hypothetical protein